MPMTDKKLASALALRTDRRSGPEHARRNNRSWVLQSLYHSGPASRADLARKTGLTRVTISDLVAELIGENLIVELGQADEVRPGKPATLVDMNRTGFQILALDLSGAGYITGAMLDLAGNVLVEEQRELADATGEAVIEHVVSLSHNLIAKATAPILGVGVGSPGIVDGAGIVRNAGNLEWHNVELRSILTKELGIPVLVANDANAAALAEHTFGDHSGDLLVLKIGSGVGSGLIVADTLILGSRFAAGEIGQVVIGTDNGANSPYDRKQTVEAWLSVPNIESRIAAGASEDQVLEEAGWRLGIVIAPVVGALNLRKVIINGPEHIVNARLISAASSTLLSRTMPEFHSEVEFVSTSLGTHAVLLGAAVLVLSERLGVS